MRLIDAIDNIFSHNEYIALSDKYYSVRVWQGMAWQLPQQYHNVTEWKIFGAIPETIDKADTINIIIHEVSE